MCLLFEKRKKYEDYDNFDLLTKLKTLYEKLSLIHSFPNLDKEEIMETIREVQNELTIRTCSL